MARMKINHDNMPARFPEGTFVRIDRVLAEGETRTDLIREAVEREVVRREGGTKLSTQPPGAE